MTEYLYKSMPRGLARTLMKAGEGAELTETEKWDLRTYATTSGGLFRYHGGKDPFRSDTSSGGGRRR